MWKRYEYLFEGMSWIRLAWTTAISGTAAGIMVWFFSNTYRDLLVSALCMGYSIMLAITVAGNLRQRRIPSEAAQMLGVVIGAVAAIPLVAVVKGRDLLVMFTERFWGVAVTAGMGIGFGCVITAMLIIREQRARTLAALHKAEAERHQLEKQVLATRLQILQAQVEPHFLFNTLANVQHLVVSDAAAAAHMLENLIRYLRIALPQMRESTSTLSREMELAAAYLEIFKIRMGNRLSYEVQLPDSLRDVEFPPMMLITLVENAIMHGIDPGVGPGTIQLNALLQDGKLVVAVADSGEGFQQTKGGGVGLGNIRERLATLYGKSAKLVLTENQPRGVIATIEIPVSDTPNAHKS